MGLVRERLVAGGVAAGGLVFTVPSVFAPTWGLVITDPADGRVLSTQSSWSWGRYVVSSGDGTSETVDNVGGLVMLVTCVLVAAIGLAVWVLLQGSIGALAGVVSTAVLGTRVLTTASERFGRSFQEAYRVSGLSVSPVLEPAAVLESMAAVLLVGAVAFMLVATYRDLAAVVPALVPRSTTSTTATTSTMSTTGAARPAEDPTTASVAPVAFLRPRTEPARDPRRGAPSGDDAVPAPEGLEPSP